MTTPTYDFPYPSPPDPDNVPLDMQELAEQIEDVLQAQFATFSGQLSTLNTAVVTADGKAVTADGKAVTAQSAAAAAQATADSALTAVSNARLGPTTKTVTNWDNANETGWYNSVAGATNAPNGSENFIGMVTVLSSSFITQDIWAYAGGSGTVLPVRYTRRKISNVWGSWVSSPLPPRLYAYTPYIANVAGNNWNNVTESGWYYGSNDSTNRPSGSNYSYGFVLAVQSDYVMQICYSREGDGLVWTRQCISGTWGSWVQVSGGGADLVYNGAYPANTPYTDGDVVIQNGIAYLCVRPTSAAPTRWPGTRQPMASYGVNLPSSPIDGDEHTLVDSITNPTYQWRFRYNAGSSSAYKWEFVGGAPYYSDNNPNVAHRSLTQVAATGWYYHNTNYLTLPRAGDYWLVADAWFSHTVACQCGIAIFNGSTAPVGRSRRDTDTPSTGAERASSTSYKLTGAAASSLAGAAFSGSADFTLKNHAISCWPVRVS